MRQLKITKQVTNRETASLDKYLQEIGKVDLITADEEVELAQRIKAGDQTALEKLTMAAKGIPLDSSPATSHMFIVKPFAGRSLLEIFSTHPPVDKRVERLRSMTGE